MSALDWPVDADGYPHREAARVLLFDDTGRVLLAKGLLMLLGWPWLKRTLLQNSTVKATQ